MRDRGVGLADSRLGDAMRLGWCRDISGDLGLQPSEASFGFPQVLQYRIAPAVARRGGVEVCQFLLTVSNLGECRPQPRRLPCPPDAVVESSQRVG